MRKWICMIAVHKEKGASNWRRLYCQTENYDASMPDWYHRFGAYFKVDPLRRPHRGMVKIDALKSWLRLRRFVEIARDDTEAGTHSMLMTPAIDEFWEFVYDIDLAEPRIRYLAGNS